MNFQVTADLASSHCRGLTEIPQIILQMSNQLKLTQSRENLFCSEKHCFLSFSLKLQHPPSENPQNAMVKFDLKHFDSEVSGFLPSMVLQP